MKATRYKAWSVNVATVSGVLLGTMALLVLSTLLVRRGSKSFHFAVGACGGRYKSGSIK